MSTTSTTKYITAELRGGLGNQLFIIAAAMSLGRKSNRVVAFEYTMPVGGTPRPAYWNTTFRSIPELSPSQCVQTVGLQEPHYHFSQDLVDFLKEASHVQCIKLYGYFQSAKYFEDMRDEIVNSLLVPISAAKVLARHNLSHGSAVCVSMHVRRGDYTLAGTQAYHGLLTLEYYSSAVSKMQNLLCTDAFTLLIFSDDKDWCVEHIIPLCKSAQIVLDDADEVEELYHMTLCNHHILSNSSFSWWGAYGGNTTKESITIAPKTWFLTKTCDSKDVPLLSWVLI